ncbi:Glycosyl transferase family 2 [Methylobacterium sp. ap11]|uniref:glycosyltransferase n=1 Tax=Methylobacterium sp. ap11 TaxID=1761799 RepID=UPI0008C6AC88|nr:glycosyltransferase [Methylobacterium sp. ap11]SEP50627.1 Glycosyl transferase family 2 [Methylobacterium sp. ap11]
MPNLFLNLNKEKYGNISCMFEIQSSIPIGGIEEGFLKECTETGLYHDLDFVQSLRQFIARPHGKYILISRNTNLIVDENLLSKINITMQRLEGFQDKWTLVSPGGLARDNKKFCSLYSSKNPFIIYNSDIQPIIDTIIDLYIINAEDLKSFFDKFSNEMEACFETAFILHGYKELDKVSLFVPDLCTGIDGDFRAKDAVKASNQIASFNFLNDGETIKTLSGNLTIKKIDTIKNDINSLKSDGVYLYVDEVIKKHINTPLISIITRTQFTRLHLIKRLLTSIIRARQSSKLQIEVVISTDIDHQIASEKFKLLCAEFININMVLSVNERTEYSRVANLLGGVDGANGEYVWFMDDDDYIDIDAFKNIEFAFFHKMRPLIFMDSDVNKEKWDFNNKHFPILASSERNHIYPGSNWNKMFNGVNHLPICAALIPTAFFKAETKNFDFKYDLSEDYTLYLILLSSENIPHIFEIEKVTSHISVRPGEDNVVTDVNRKIWTRDITCFLYDALYANPKYNGRWNVIIRNHLNSINRVEANKNEHYLKTMHDKNIYIKTIEAELKYLRNEMIKMRQEVVEKEAIEYESK